MSKALHHDSNDKALMAQRRNDWPLETLWNQDAVDGTFRDILKSFFGSENPVARAFEGQHDMMKLEEFLDNGACVIRAEAPGVDPEKDVDLSIRDGVLRLSVRREQTEESRDAEGYRSEFRYGHLVRNLRVPEGTTESDVTATYKDGILEVRVPAPKAAAPGGETRIPITRG